MKQEDREELWPGPGHSAADELAALLKIEQALWDLLTERLDIREHDVVRWGKAGNNEKLNVLLFHIVYLSSV